MDVGAEVREGQSNPWEEETLPPISLAPVPRTGSNPSPSSENSHKASPWLLGNLAKGLMQITLLQALPQNPGPVPALELQGPD